MSRFLATCAIEFQGVTLIVGDSTQHERDTAHEETTRPDGLAGENNRLG
jgi:hypothetical protein